MIVRHAGEVLRLYSLSLRSRYAYFTRWEGITQCVSSAAPPFCLSFLSLSVQKGSDDGGLLSFWTCPSPVILKRTTFHRWRQRQVVIVKHEYLRFSLWIVVLVFDCWFDWCIYFSFPFLSQFQVFICISTIDLRYIYSYMIVVILTSFWHVRYRPLRSRNDQ
jgi:hypothetical protein